METRLEQVEQNFTALFAEISSLSAVIGLGFTKVDANFDSVKKEIDILHKKVESLIKKVDSLEGNTNDGFEDVGLKLESLTEEITKISKVTGYDQQFGNMTVIK